MSLPAVRQAGALEQLLRRAVAWQSGLSGRGIWTMWLLTRALCVLAVSPWASGRLGTQGLSADVLGIYAHVHGTLASGLIPYRDFAYPYPPGTLLFLVLPFRHVGASTFLDVYVAEMLFVDALVLATLHRRQTSGRLAAARLWTFGGAATLGLLLGRNDLPACLAALTGLFAYVDDRRARSAALLAVGSLIKVWPLGLAVIAVVARPGRVRIFAAAFAAVGGAVLLPFALVGAAGDLWRELVVYHSGRGVEVEAVVALPALMWHELTGRSEDLSPDHGSINLAASTRLGELCTAAGLLVVVALVCWILRVRRTRGPLSTVSVLCAACLLVDGSLIAAKVLSPQYVLWLLVVVCAARSHDAIDTATARLTLAIVATTALEFPLSFTGLYLSGARGAVPVVLLAVRDGLLLAVAWRCWAQLRRSVAPPAPRVMPGTMQPVATRPTTQGRRPPQSSAAASAPTR
jgi:hypothetical protein